MAIIIPSIAMNDYPGRLFPFSNSVPYSFAQATTHMEMVEGLIRWINEQLIPQIDANNAGFAESVSNELESMALELSRRLEEFRLADEEVHAELREEVAAAVDAIINASIKFTGPILGFVYVDDFKQATDASDAEAIERAIVYAQANNTPIVQFGPRVYEVHRGINIVGVNRLHFRGAHKNVTRIKAKLNSGTIFALFYASTTGANFGKLEWSGIGFDGGITNADALGDGYARALRTFTPDRILSAIRIFGGAVPGADWVNVPKLGDVTVHDCEFYGLQELPLFVGGSSGVVKVYENTFYRSLDTGFVFNNTVMFSNNDVRYSADNGVSVSRGNKHATVTGNTFDKSWFWNIWLGGFTNSPGPEGKLLPANGGAMKVSITGNTGDRAGSGGVAVQEAGAYGTITGNLFTDTPRGAEGTSTYGLGIYFLGFDAVDAWAKVWTVSGNTISGMARGGILVRRRSGWINIIGNTIHNAGSEFSQTGGAPITNTGLDNFGISVQMNVSEMDAGQVGPIQVVDNLITDDRAVPLTSYGTFVTQRLIDEGIVARHGNKHYRTTRASGEDGPIAVHHIADGGVGVATGFQLRQGGVKRVELQTDGNNDGLYNHRTGKYEIAFISGEGIRVGDAAEGLGFYGKAPVARPTLPVGATTAQIEAVLLALGLIVRP